MLRCYGQAIGSRAGDDQVLVNYQLTISQINGSNARSEIDCITDEASRIACRNDPEPLSFPLQTAYPPGHGIGAGVGVGIPDGTQYLPPVFTRPLLVFPPQTTISLPVQTAV